MTATALSAKEAMAHARETVARSGTSFAAGMRILSRPRRDAMHAIYAFCRKVDDIADGDAATADKKRLLQDWRAEVDRLYAGAPLTPAGAALLVPVRSFDLPKAEFLLMIEGMEMDADGPIVAPTMDRLLAYTRRVAGAVGMLSMPVFGAPRTPAAERFALALGDALQLTNILRDVEEDAAIGRLYLPRELLEKYGAPLTPRDIAGAPELPHVKAALGAIAEARFAATRAAVADLDWKVLRPALLMMGVYEALLTRLKASGWKTARLVNAEKAAIAARWYFAPKLKKA